jgi:hypothetical protein
VLPEAEQTEHHPDASELKQIESELTEDLLTLFDDNGLTREQTLALLGRYRF